MREKMESAGNQQERLTDHVLEPKYIVGLVDGEGYFSVQARKRLLVDGYYAHAVDFVFGVQLQEKDQEILHSLQKFFGCGKVVFKPRRKTSWSDCYEYRVTKLSDIREKILPFFHEHPLKFPTKRNAFTGFCTILGLIEQRRHISDEGITRIRSLARALH